MEIDMTYADRFRAVLDRHNLSQARAAALLHGRGYRVTTRTVERWLSDPGTANHRTCPPWAARELEEAIESAS